MSFHRPDVARRPAVPFALAACALPLALAGCAAPNYRTLDEGGTKAALITASEFASDGWSGLGLTDAAAKDPADTAAMFAGAKGVPVACTTAMKSIGMADSRPDAGASVSLTDDDQTSAGGQLLDIAVRSFAALPGTPSRISEAAKACAGQYPISSDGSTGSITVTAPSYDVSGAAAIGLTVTSASTNGASTPDASVEIVALSRGNNLLTMTVIAADETRIRALVEKALPLQVTKLEKVATS